VSSTQANWPSSGRSKPRHSLKNRGASERDRAKPSDLPVVLDINPQNRQSARPRCAADAARARRRGDRMTAKMKRREFITLLGLVWTASFTMIVHSLDLAFAGHPEALAWTIYAGGGYWLALTTVALAEEALQ